MNVDQILMVRYSNLVPFELITFLFPMKLSLAPFSHKALHCFLDDNYSIRIKKSIVQCISVVIVIIV